MGGIQPIPANIFKHNLTMVFILSLPALIKTAFDSIKNDENNTETKDTLKERILLMWLLKKYQKPIMAMILLLSVTVVYEKVRSFDFINFDDDIYVTNNTHVKSGLTLDNVRWAFSFDSSRDMGTYFHPLTWISHMLDVQLFRLQPGMHHLVNLAFHLINTLLLFLILWKMTNAYWKSLFVAMMFGLHPVNVDSVAWIAERKNLLSTCFLLLAIFTYWFYTKKPGFLRYILALSLFGCGLLTKPMVVTLPFILLLLDYWPLSRFKMHSPNMRDTGITALILEKIPFAVLALIMFCTSSYSLINQYIASETVPWSLRIAHALISYCIYAGKFLLPLNLAIHHPYPSMVSVWQISGALLVLVGSALLVFFFRKKYPFLVLGWLWYLGTLIPVLGIIQAGHWPSYAERWAYVPFIGLFILIAWGLPVLIKKLGGGEDFTVAFSAILIIFWGTLTWAQTGYWQNSLLAFTHAVDVTKNNCIGHNNLGRAYEELGFTEKAFEQYAEAVRISPGYALGHCNLGLAYAHKNNFQEAQKHLLIAQRLQPRAIPAYLYLGYTYARFGEPRKAIFCYQQALELNPHVAKAYYNLGNICKDLNMMPEAMLNYEQAIRIEPGFAEAYCNLGTILSSFQRYDEARKYYAAALEINPGLLIARENLQNISGFIERKKEANPK